MRVLMVHNYYRRRGGEDVAFEAEVGLLRSNGCEVLEYCVDSAAVSDWRLAASTLWAQSHYNSLRRLAKTTKPDVVHIHNTFPRLSPAVLHAVADRPLVHTLPNYRLLCPNGLLFRDGRPCRDCLGKAFAWSGIRQGCYRDNRGATALVATATALHRLLGSWNKVDVFITPSDAAKSLFVQAGLAAHRIEVKRPVVPDPGVGRGEGGYALMAGRLDAGKGVGTLLAAWSRRAVRRPLRLVGDGPLLKDVAAAARDNPYITWMGWQESAALRALMRDAVCLIVPSECYETGARVAVEAMACGTPVIAADHGALRDVVIDGQTGLRFRPGDAGDLLAKTERVFADRALRERLRAAARRHYRARFTPKHSFGRLMAIYGRAMDERNLSVTFAT